MRLRIILPSVMGIVSLPLVLWDIHNERVIGWSLVRFLGNRVRFHSCIWIHWYDSAARWVAPVVRRGLISSKGGTSFLFCQRVS
jgi:hypothetical protein